MAQKKVSIEEKVSQYLSSGKVNVVSVDSDKQSALLHVKSSTSDGDPYYVTFNGEWHCDCPARVSLCVHIRAAMKIISFSIRPPTLAVSSPDSAWLDKLLGK